MAGTIQGALMVAVRAFIDAFNRNDVIGAQAASTSETTIIDDLPPHLWTGSQATTRWLSEMARMGAESAMSDPAVTPEEPRHVLVSDRRGYFVVPVDVRWLQNGRPDARTGSMTFAVGDEGDGWRISALAWNWD